MKTILSISIALVLLVGTIAAVQTNAAFAAERKQINVDAKRDFVLHIDKVNGGVDINVKGAGGSTGGGTVNATDQVARDGVAQLRAEDVNQNNRLDTVTSESQVVKGNISNISDQLNSANSKISSLTSELNTVKAQIANLTSQNPVIDVNVTNGTATGGGNTTGGGTGTNNTGGGTNNTNSTGGNGTIPVVNNTGGNVTGGNITNGTVVNQFLDGLAAALHLS